MSRIYSIFLAFVFSMSTLSLVPIMAHAEEDSIDGQTSIKQREIDTVRARQTADSAERIAELCKRYTNSRLGKTTDNKRNEFNTKLSGKSIDLAEKRKLWDEKRIESRAKADAKRLEHYAKLLENATTENQKQAIADFQAAIENAVGIRRVAQDEARDTYRAGVDSALVGRKTNLEAASAEFKLAVEAAVAKAKISCENGTSVDEVKATIKTDLDAAKAEFREAKKENNKISEQIRALLEIRKEAVRAAKDAFDSAMADAKAALEAALAADTGDSE